MLLCCSPLVVLLRAFIRSTCLSELGWSSELLVRILAPSNATLWFMHRLRARSGLSVRRPCLWKDWTDAAKLLRNLSITSRSKLEQFPRPCQQKSIDIFPNRWSNLIDRHVKQAPTFLWGGLFDRSGSDSRSVSPRPVCWGKFRLLCRRFR